MKNYELTYLISSELSEEKAKQLSEKIASLIQEKEGVLVEEKLPFKKKLAYPVKKQSQAYLAVANFQMLAEKLIDLEKKIKLENQILRYLILVKTPVKKVKITRLLKKTKIDQPEKAASKGGEPRPILSEREKKVELEEIEKKLEEILSDEG